MYIFSLNICEILRFKRFSPRKLKIMTRACYQQKLTTTTTKVKQSHTDNNAQRAKKAKRKHERQKTTRPRRRHTKEPKKKQFKPICIVYATDINENIYPFLACYSYTKTKKYVKRET